jgi:glycosyltransferase involved in cell wall biosynthesis
MKQADVFVCTADQDCNAKIHEYLRWERPFLGYDGRANLLFKNGENAILCKPRDYPAAILRLAGDPALRSRLTANAKRDIPVHSWAEIAARFDTVFMDLVS